METTEYIATEFKAKVSEAVRLHEEGVNRYRLFTPFTFDDGDGFSIVLRKNGDGWLLSDEGHTFMHMSYEMDMAALEKGNRAELLDSVLNNFGISESDGSLELRFNPEDAGNALYTYLQALTKITDLSYLNREIVKSTFIEDFKQTLETDLPDGRYKFDFHFEEYDPQKSYPVDCFVNGMDLPLLIFAIQNDDKCRDVTISLHQFEKWGIPFRSLAIFENQTDINRKVLARFSDVSDKQFSSLISNRERIGKYLKTALK
ncbi:DUF1828 domain-containing protein [Rhodohalobacter sp.]|uniref:DUF1828 domain-containing protein n=1 Tax=Rhodohalobacter sp. TaxID=1974210 RepID=UPI002ACD6F44|nr:DUF1828 domain-containing protein [Rhodohalobacter sp.]MDZ7754782.1 DUF1828 domain-containing protein [Rhodohalobacter sp.]